MPPGQISYLFPSSHLLVPPHREIVPTGDQLQRIFTRIAKLRVSDWWLHANTQSIIITCIWLMIFRYFFSSTDARALSSRLYKLANTYPSAISRTMTIYPWQNSPYSRVRLFLDFLFRFAFFFIRYCWRHYRYVVAHATELQIRIRNINLAWLQHKPR